MFSFLNKNRILVNPIMRDFFMNSTNESIRKMTEKHNSVIILKKPIDCFMSNDNPSLPDNNDLIIPFLCLLSSSTILYYFYKSSL